MRENGRVLHLFGLFFPETNSDRAAVPPARNEARCRHTKENRTDIDPAFVGLAVHREREAINSHKHSARAQN